MIPSHPWAVWPTECGPLGPSGRSALRSGCARTALVHLPAGARSLYYTSPEGALGNRPSAARGAGVRA